MRKYMSWAYVNTTRMYDEIDKYNDKFEMISLFYFNVDSTGTITGSIPSEMMDLINKYPNKKWYIAVIANAGYTISYNLMYNVNGARDKLLSEINRLIDIYPWCYGIDWDFEQGGSYSNKDAALQLFTLISQTVRARGKKIHFDLPPLTAAYTTVGNEKWCAYETLNGLFDTATIMSYGMAWAGSAPGPISPRDWLEKIYNYAARVFDMSKIYMGLPGYGFRWQIDHYPAEGSYRAISATYLAFKYWIEGKYNHTEGTANNTQPYIPFAAYWDDNQKTPYLLLHVYDWQDSRDNISKIYPTVTDEYNGKYYSTAYSLKPEYSYTNDIHIPMIPCNNYSGALLLGVDYIAARAPQLIQTGTDASGNPIYELEEPGTASYTFDINEAGTYDIVAQVNFTWWDANYLSFSIDGTEFIAQQPNQWYPMARSIHYIKVGEMDLSAGSHSITFNGANSAYKCNLYEVMICKNFSFQMTGGEISYNIKPTKFKDVNGNTIQPTNGYKITLEVLRRQPEGALIWSDDFRGYAPINGQNWLSNLFNLYYNISGGNWYVEGVNGLPSHLKQSNSVGLSQVNIKYNGFNDISVKTRFSFNGQEAGVIIGNAQIILKSGYIIGKVNGTQQVSVTANISGFNTFRIHTTNGIAKVYFNDSYIFSLNGVNSYTFGLYTNNATLDATLLECYDSHYYSLREAIEIITPYGTELLGRNEWNATYDPIYNVIYVTDGDVSNKRISGLKISMEWDYLHSSSFNTNNEFILKIKSKDLGVWVANIYLVDADGASIAYYSDINSYVYWMNRAEFEWNCRGIGVWALGMQDPDIYKYIP